ncbi:E3 ubiquitin-protein ligase MBR2-like, partial [Musa acuminata AAA Group]|uniref:E3 ubiquitin-protein ligase MBR2-like n=1 Tax=Musa acuminata AAA Group TaxID=214697 RepID=UPI0031DAE49D
RREGGLLATTRARSHPLSFVTCDRRRAVPPSGSYNRQRELRAGLRATTRAVGEGRGQVCEQRRRELRATGPCARAASDCSRRREEEEGGAFRVGGASEEASQAYAPAAASARSYSDWQRNRPRGKAKRKEERRSRDGGDVWCAPRVPFASEASVDCVVSYRRLAGSGRRDAADRTHSEVILMFQRRILLGRMDLYDQYRDWQLDVDNMSYDELLELGDRIGHVSTGLKEEEIIGSLRKVKHSFFYALKRFFSTEIDGKCSICQEEYEANDEIGELDCGHSYHVFCIKQWLLQKNVCPVSKTSVPRT